MTYLIDEIMRRIIEFDFNREHGAADEILSCDGRGGFTLGSGPLAPPRDSDGSGVADYNVADYFLADYCYVSETYPQIAEPAPGMKPPWHILGVADGIKGDPRFWFQIDADLGRPASLPIPGRGLIVGVTIDGDWCSARISLEQLTARVSFARRNFAASRLGAECSQARCGLAQWRRSSNRGNHDQHHPDRSAILDMPPDVRRNHLPRGQHRRPGSRETPRTGF